MGSFECVCVSICLPESPCGDATTLTCQWHRLGINCFETVRVKSCEAAKTEDKIDKQCLSDL